MTKKRVLFVDDEPNILNGLRRMLRSMRREWDMSFAHSGPDALEMLAAQPSDVIVSDMRMPGMDGAALLREVMSRHPRTVRIVLSGQADREAILGAVGPIHQYLSKPCDADTLKSTLTHVLTLDELLPDEHLKQLISQLETLPSLPALYEKVIGELQSPEASTANLAQFISLDMGMSAKVLQLVNSAFFGLRQHIPGPTQAVISLGLDTIKILGLSARVFTQFERTQLEALSLTSLWDHSVTVGEFAREIAQSEGAEQPLRDYAFVAGLLHDVGKLVLATILPEQYSSVQALVTEKATGLLEAEREIIGASHPAVGAYLLGLWGLPQSVVEALAFHHTPKQHQAEAFNPVTAIHVANGLAYELSGEQITANFEIDQSYLAGLGLTGRLPEWRKFCQATMRNRSQS